MKNYLLLFLVNISTLVIAQDTARLSLVFMGDVMQHDSQIADAWDATQKTYDYTKCFQHIKPYVQSADFAFGNLEVTLAGKPYKGYPQFSAPDQLVTGLVDMGTDVLVTANNHCVDRGRKGLERTIDVLDSMGIPHTGTFKNVDEKEKNHPLLLEKKGFRLALLNFTYGTNGLPVHAPNIVNMIEPESIRRDLAKAKSMQVDAIIVFVHWGSEYQSLPSQWQKDIAKLFFDNGADIVIGAHPHVIQPMEWRKDKKQFIAYSLGNFVSGQRKRYTDGGAMVRLELIKTESKETQISKAEYILEWVHRDIQRNYVVWPVAELESGNLYRLLNEESRIAFKTFTGDSRALLLKHNINVTESKTSPVLSDHKESTDTLGVQKH